MVIDITNEIDSINTSETYNKYIFHYKQNFVFPYINLQIIKDNIIPNFSKDYFIDFSYLIITNVTELEWDYTYNGENIYQKVTFDPKKQEESKTLTDYFMGGDMDEEISGCQFKIIFERLYLVYTHSSRISNNMWIPLNTPNFSGNISSKKVSSFFLKEKLNNEILSILETPNSNKINRFRFKTPIV